MKRLLLFISTLLCANVLLSQEIVIDEIKYVITGINEVEVNKYQGSATAVNIPSNINYGGYLTVLLLSLLMRFLIKII